MGKRVGPVGCTVKLELKAQGPNGFVGSMPYTRHGGMSMWLDLDPPCGVAMSKGRGSVGYKILSLAHAKGVTALEKK